MTNTQRLEQEIAPIDASAELAGLFDAVVQQAVRAAAEIWNELRQWG